MLNPIEADHVLMIHRARTECVNRTRWRYEPPAGAGERRDAEDTFQERLRQRAGVALIHAGERLLAPRPLPVLSDCEPQPATGG